MSRALVSLVALVVLAAVTWAGLSWLDAHRPQPQRTAPRELGPVPVRVRVLVPETAHVQVRAYGTLLPAREAELAPEIQSAAARLLVGSTPPAVE